MKDPIDLAIVQRVLEVLILHIMVKVVIEVGVIDGVYVDMVMDMGPGFLEERVVPLDISSVD